MPKIDSFISSTLATVAAGVLAAGLAAGSAQAQSDTIRVGVQSVPPDEVFLAKDWLEPYGITGEVTQFSSGGDMLQAFVAGRIDVANGGSARLVTMAANQPELFYIVATHQFGGDRYGVIVGTESEDSAIEDLVGKKIGAVTGSGTYETFRVYLEQNGLTENDFEVVNMKVQEIRTAVQQGIIDAGVAWEPHVAIAETSGAVKRIISLDGVNASPNFYLVSREFADENPDTVAAFLAGLIDISDFIKENPEEAGQMVADNIAERGVEVDPKAMEMSFQRISLEREVTDDLVGELLPIAESMVESNRIDEVPDFAALVRDDLYAKARELSAAQQ